MARRFFGLCAFVFANAMLGCGPLHSPMPPRLDDEGQQEADKSWNDAFTPVDRLDHQTLLDAFVATQAYQIGVDRLVMRSEKQLKHGLLVMEIHFDRTKPDDDRFEVSLFDEANRRVRYDKYSRADVKRSYEELFPSIPSENGSVRVDPEPEQWKQKRALAKKRLEVVKKLLPKEPAEETGK